MINKKILLPLSLLAITTSSHAAATSFSVAGTGWNQDVIVENTAAVGSAGVLASTSIGIASFNFYEQDWSTGKQGLNNTGAISSLGSSYQLQPYDESNAFVNTGMFNLTIPTKFETMSFLVSNVGGENEWSATVNYADTSTTMLTFDGVDWTDGATSPEVLNNHGLASRVTDSFYEGGLHMTERTIPVDPSKTVESITFATTSGTNVIHAVAAKSAAVPEPSSAALLGLGALALIIRRRK